MAEDRERTVELMTAIQVADPNVYCAIKENNPMLAKLMMDKLKSFLSNEYFATMERQTILMKFLEEHEDHEIIQDLLTYLDTIELKKDYQTIIMEWTFHNSEKIKSYNLAKYDGSLLSMSKKLPKPVFNEPQATEGTDEFVQAILSITTELLNDGKDNDDGENLI